MIDEFAQQANNPWDRYLQARKEAITWMREKLSYDDETIARNISILSREVGLIYESSKKEENA